MWCCLWGAAGAELRLWQTLWQWHNTAEGRLKCPVDTCRKLRCSAVSEGIRCQMVVFGVSTSNSLMPLGLLGIFSLLVQLHWQGVTHQVVNLLGKRHLFLQCVWKPFSGFAFFTIHKHKNIELNYVLLCYIIWRNGHRPWQGTTDVLSWKCLVYLFYDAENDPQQLCVHTDTTLSPGYSKYVSCTETAPVFLLHHIPEALLYIQIWCPWRPQEDTELIVTFKKTSWRGF